MRPSFRRRRCPSAPPSGAVGPSVRALAQPLEDRRLLSASLLMDINTRPESSSPQDMIEFGGGLYVSANGPAGRELYRSDGTAAGTTLLKDIRPGTEGSLPRDFTIAGDYLYFTAGNGSGTDRNLWRTDGTAAGTVQLTGAAPATHFANPAHLTVVGDALYFAAYDPAAGASVWKTDGTPGGTSLVFNPPGGPGNLDVGVSGIAPAGSGGAFIATPYSPSDITAKLWKTDGTPAGTVELRDFGLNNVLHLTAAGGGRVVFSAEPDANGREPWVSDGTPEGTRLLRDLRTIPVNGSVSGLPQQFININGTVFFSGNSDVSSVAALWKTDGTPEGTSLVRAIDSHLYTELGGVLYFSAVLGATGGLWRSDGTDAGTYQVSDQVPSDGMVASGGKLFFFSSRPGMSGLWKSDGTTAGTQAVAPLSTRSSLTRFNDGVAFAATDSTGSNVWTSDGTTAGTASIGAFDPTRTISSVPYSGSPYFPSNPLPATLAPVRLGGRTVFVANSGSGGVLWATDGTTAGTARIATFNGTQIQGIAAATRPDGTAFAYVLSRGGANNGADAMLWTTDGTDAGTARVRTVVTPTSGPALSMESLAVRGGVLYFSGDLPEQRRGLEPMKSDGTAAGTVRIKDLSESPAPILVDSNVARFTVVGDAVYFVARGASTQQGGNELWKTDGTPEGTVLVRSFMPAPGYSGGRVRSLAGVNGRLVFRVQPVFGGSFDQIWTSDGTPAGTVMVREFSGPLAGSIYDYDSLAVLGGAAYFMASPLSDPINVELWKTDGTAAGTVRVKDIYPGNMGSAPGGIKSLGGRLYFSAQDPDAGVELWTSDGTEAGTRRLTDIAPGPGGSMPKVLGEAWGRVYFGASNSARGYELYSTDGTPAGTVLAAEVAPGVTSSFPFHAVEAANGRVLFWADDNHHDREPWVLDVPPAAVPFVRGRHVFYNNSRFDDRDPAANLADDGAVATDKQPLRPGGLPSAANVTNYSRGLNGVMVDLDSRFGFFDDVRLSFRAGRGGDPAAWREAPAPLSITRRIDGVPEEVERVTAVWADGALRNTWLRVTVEAVLDGRVVASDVFYYGNLAGETGGPPSPAPPRVDAADYARTRAAISSRRASVTSPYDHNRDGVVNVLDLAAVRANFLATLPAPTPPASAAAVAPAAAAAPQRALRPAYRHGLLTERDAAGGGAGS